MAGDFQFDVFLSHTQADKPRGRSLTEPIWEAGLRRRFDEWTLQPRDDTCLDIERRLQASRTMALCLSPTAPGSDLVGQVAWQRCHVLLNPRFAECFHCDERTRNDEIVITL